MMPFKDPMKYCSICENVTKGEHNYKINDKEYFVCDTCWNVIKAIIEENK